MNTTPAAISPLENLFLTQPVWPNATTPTDSPTGDISRGWITPRLHPTEIDDSWPDSNFLLAKEEDRESTTHDNSLMNAIQNGDTMDLTELDAIPLEKQPFKRLQIPIPPRLDNKRFSWTSSSPMRTRTYSEGEMANKRNQPSLETPRKTTEPDHFNHHTPHNKCDDIARSNEAKNVIPQNPIEIVHDPATELRPALSQQLAESTNRWDRIRDAIHERTLQTASPNDWLTLSDSDDSIPSLESATNSSSSSIITSSDSDNKPGPPAKDGSAAEYPELPASQSYLHARVDDLIKATEALAQFTNILTVRLRELALTQSEHQGIDNNGVHSLLLPLTPPVSPQINPIVQRNQTVLYQLPQIWEIHREDHAPIPGVDLSEDEQELMPAESYMNIVLPDGADDDSANFADSGDDTTESTSKGSGISNESSPTYSPVTNLLLVFLPNVITETSARYMADTLHEWSASGTIFSPGGLSEWDTQRAFEKLTIDPKTIDVGSQFYNFQLASYGQGDKNEIGADLGGQFYAFQLPSYEKGPDDAIQAANYEEYQTNQMSDDQWRPTTTTLPQTSQNEATNADTSDASSTLASSPEPIEETDETNYPFPEMTDNFNWNVNEKTDQQMANFLRWLEEC
ncbi:hypothetical protein B0H16DRAFT_1724487 [Mycena metata]|uniref:Uncharacterized protein n=1 Tax=Mycena metata TaxID=1033252 RepID=A0AAD7IW55_9AGAR|nr:hypothetical protein B0H16DRAFT_1724487 [Mycena metata]